MDNGSHPEILPPPRPVSPGLRARARSLFSNDNLDLLAHLLDDWFRIPGTPIRLGLDGLIGLIPGLGDALAGLASCILIFAAWIRGVPFVTLVRMLVNVALEVSIGAVPFFGDIFIVAWKANRRNYRLLTRHLAQPRVHTWKDAAFLLVLLGGILAILAAPLIVLLLIVAWLLHRL